MLVVNNIIVVITITIREQSKDNYSNHQSNFAKTDV